MSTDGLVVQTQNPVLIPAMYKHPREDEYRALVDTGIVARDAIVTYYRDIVEPMRVPDLAAMVQAGPEQFSHVDREVEWMSAALALPKPRVFIYYKESYGAYAEGLSQPWVELSSKAVEELTRDEVRFLLARELVRIQCGHVLYQILIDQMLRAANYLNAIPGVGTVLGLVGPDRVAQALKLLFYRYTRVVEHTVDRGAWLLTGNLVVAATTIMKQVLRSGNLASMSSVPAWYAQGKQIDDMTGMLAYYTKIDERVPYGPHRIRDLVEFASQRASKHVAVSLQAWRKNRGVDE